MSRPASPAALVLAAIGAVVAVAAGLLLLAWVVRTVAPDRLVPLVDGPPPFFEPAPAGTEILLGAGDIARCDSDGDEATARLLDALAGSVFTAGDNAYDRGSPEDFARCYEPTWGRHRERTRFPAAGNHDWETAGAAGYLGYFGPLAAPDGATWYVRELGRWRVVVLDSTCERVGGCGEGSAQLAWLREELATEARCRLAIWHRPRFSSGPHGGAADLQAFWEALAGAGAELVISGHDHHYERFAPLDAVGGPDPQRGVRQFVVGTGGAPLRPLGSPHPHSEVRNAEARGILRLELAPRGYRWQFVPIAGHSFADEGAGRCH